MRSFVAAIAITLVGLSCYQPVRAEPAAPDARSAEEQQNLAFVLDFWNNVYVPKKLQRLPEYFAVDYIDHNPNITGRGIPALLEYFAGMRKRASAGPQPAPAEPPRSDVIASFVHADLVTLIRTRTLPDPSKPSQRYEAFGFEMFRVRDGKIVEHWDSITKR